MGFDYQFQADLRTDDANPAVQTERLTVRLATKDGTPNEVLLCDKGEDSFIKVSHASDRDQIEAFRKRFTLGELWRQGVLGGIP